jgi:S-disulfanyl-L-cysteine oxidoreductase SoxD
MRCTVMSALSWARSFVPSVPSAAKTFVSSVPSVAKTFVSSVPSVAKPFVTSVCSVAPLFALSVAVAAQAPRTTTWDGVYTAEQAKRGEALYRTHCGACHGGALEGAEAAPALTGTVFTATWEGVLLSDLFERARSSMPQDKPGSLSRPQNADILAFILQVGKFPAGEKPLDAMALESITFVTYRPSR